MGFEPMTFSLARRHSTAKLRPHLTHAEAQNRTGDSLIFSQVLYQAELPRQPLHCTCLFYTKCRFLSNGVCFLRGPSPVVGSRAKRSLSRGRYRHGLAPVRVSRRTARYGGCFLSLSERATVNSLGILGFYPLAFHLIGRCGAKNSSSPTCGPTHNFLQQHTNDQKYGPVHCSPRPIQYSHCPVNRKRYKAN